jgi:DNA polymerase-4
MEKRLRASGINDVAQLYATSSAQLRAVWGSVEGARFHDWLHGGVQERATPPPRTIGHSQVLPPEKRAPAAALAVLHRLLQKAAMRLRHENFYAGHLRLSLGYRDDTAWSADLRFNETQDTLLFTHALNELWSRRPAAHHAKVLLQVGVILERLLPSAQHTGDLFEAEQEKTRTKLHHAVDTLNKTFGKNSVYFGGALGATDYAPLRIAFTRIPNPELEEIDPIRERRLKAKAPPAPTPEED